jgi:hypothetical protein
MHKTKGISPKLAGAIGPPLTAVVTAMIAAGTVDRTSLAALAAVLIGAALGYHAPVGKVTAAPAPGIVASTTTTTSPVYVAQPAMAGTMGPVTGDWRKGVPVEGAGDDGDDALPAELETHPVDTAPVDEVDVADLNHPEVN